MTKRFLCFALISLLLITNSATILSQTKTDDSAAKIKIAILKRGIGKNKRVEVRMLNDTKLKGFVSQAGEDSFTLTDSKTKQTTIIAYADVAKVKNRSSKNDKIALAIIGGAAAVAAIVVISLISVRCRNEGGC